MDRISIKKITEETFLECVIDANKISIDMLRADIYHILHSKGITSFIKFKNGIDKQSKLPYMKIYLSGNVYEEITIYP